MAVRNILVAFNGGDASVSALKLALLMAEKYDAHLTGIVAHGPSSASRSAPSWAPESVKKAVQEVSLALIEAIKERFMEIASDRVKPEMLHWIDARADPLVPARATGDTVIAQYALVYDLTVIGQYENSVRADEVALHPERIAYECGRPIIVVPRDFQDHEINEYAVIAWDGKPSASRAVFDAMLMLETKTKVDVVTVGKPKFEAQDKRSNLIEGFKRHGVNSQKITLPEASHPMREIMNYCTNNNAGILVMGAYGHSKLAEDLFGGNTADVFKDIRLPIFLSH